MPVSLKEEDLVFKISFNPFWIYTLRQWILSCCKSTEIRVRINHRI